MYFRWGVTGEGEWKEEEKKEERVSNLKFKRK
jgi:hypothetical protein